MDDFFVPKRDKSYLKSGDWATGGGTDTEWMEDLTNGERENLTAQSNITNTSPTITSYENYLYDELFEKNQQLENQCRILEKKNFDMQQEIEKLGQQLTDEKYRANKYQKKLQYIQDNHEIFERLKQAYLTLKYNESASRPLVEVTEKGCQAFVKKEGDSRDDDIVDTLAKIGRVVDYEDRPCTICVSPGYIAVRKADFDAVKQTVQLLKNLIVTRPLSTFVMTEEREAKYRKDIVTLFQENTDLKQEVIDKKLALDLARKQMTAKRSQKETSMLRKIIAKLEIKLKGQEPVNVYAQSPESSVSDLNDREKKMVEHITAKYDAKIRQKITSSAVTVSVSGTSIQNAVSTPFCTPRVLKDIDLLPGTSDLESPKTFRSCLSYQDLPTDYNA